MSDKSTTDNQTPSRAIFSPFKFGEYVSPTVKPIPIGIKYKRSPLVEYKICESTKTESKPILKPRNKHKIEEKEPENDNLYASNILKNKIQKQQQELQFLQSQLDELQIQKPRQTEKNKTIAFDPSVHIIDENPTHKSLKSIDLTDKMSSIRPKKDLTPYKIKIKNDKPTKASRGNYRVTPMPQIRHKQVLFNSELQTDIINKPIQSSRIYRDTPIPQMQHKRAAFKKQLAAVEYDIKSEEINDIDSDKENSAIQLINENSETPKDIHKLKSCITPMLNKNKTELETTKGFKFESTSDSFIPTTPTFMYPSKNGNSNSGSTQPTPILTPIKGNKEDPFQFNWNKQNHE